MSAANVLEHARAALRTRLLTTPGLPAAAQRAWENYDFTPTVGVPWVRDALSGGAAELRSVGPRGRVRHEGLYFLDFFHPGDKGMKPSDALVDELVTTTFYPGLQVGYAGLFVTVRRVTRQLPLHEPGWVQVPITVAWYAHSVNPA